MDKYPLPDYAVSVWVTGDSLMIAFPGTVTEQGHTIKLPASAGGLQAAVNIMKDRARAKSLKLGNGGTPTQWDVERLAALNKAFNENGAVKRQQSARERDEAAEFLKELGL